MVSEKGLRSGSASSIDLESGILPTSILDAIYNGRIVEMEGLHAWRRTLIFTG